MHSHVLSAGVRAELPNLWDLTDATIEAQAAIRTEDPDFGTILYEACQEVVGAKSAMGFRCALNITPRSTAGRSAAEEEAEAAETTGHLSVDVADDRDAVLLVEEDGVLQWIKPARRVGSTREFDLELEADRMDESGPPEKRGFIVDWLFDKARVYVLDFVAGYGVPKIRDWLERNVVQGPVLIRPNEEELNQWTYPDDLSGVSVASGRKVLLLIHGTISSTAGSFGAMGESVEGLQFLRKATSEYAAVIGFDHPTLSVDPRENAEDLIAALQAIDWQGQTPTFDVVCFSRGALVYRSMSELLVEKLQGIQFGTVIFVGSTNSGTLLAEPDNWDDFLTLYTNIAVFGAKLLKSFAPTTSTVLEQTLRTLQGLVQAVVQRGITLKATPGLAAMEPDGEFVTTINRHQNGQPEPGDCSYCAITSNFDASGLDEEQNAWLKRVALKLADGSVDALFRGEDNDLVVHVASMTQFDTDGYVNERFDFPAEEGVFHTIYFTHPDTIARLVEWLGLAG